MKHVSSFDLTFVHSHVMAQFYAAFYLLMVSLLMFCAHDDVDGCCLCGYLFLFTVDLLFGSKADLIVEVAHPDISHGYGSQFLATADYMVGILLLHTNVLYISKPFFPFSSQILLSVQFLIVRTL